MVKRKELKILSDAELMDQFAYVASKCVPEPLVNLEYKKNDKKNIDRIVTYKNSVEDYIVVIRELKSRGYTLQEIMEIR
jgi:hypothetical protein